IQAREGDDLASLLAAVDDPATRSATTAERAVLASLGGGCMLPVATYARHEGGVLVVEAAVTSEDGARQVRARASGDPTEAAALGAGVAERLADTEALDAALRREHDWVIFTSINGVAAMQETIPPANPTRVAAVGPATAEALASAGVGVDFVPSAYTTAALASELPGPPSRVC